MKYLNPILSLVLAALFLSCSINVASSDHDSISDNSRSNNKNLYKALGFTAAYYTGSLLILSNTWYKDRERVPFHFYNDNQGYLQVDKFGHAFGSYVYSYIGFHYLKKTGLTRKEALMYGATLGFVLQFPIEIMDGIYEGYGFSFGDLTANALGSFLVLGQELAFREQLVKYKFSYWESPYSRNANGYLGETTFSRIFDDYNAHTYWLSFPVNEIAPINFLPDWLNIATGYSANGMYGEFENITSYNGIEIPETERYRQFLLSLDIDWTRISTDSKFLKVLFKGMTFIKLPFPALEYNSLGKFRGYWMYY
jgi:hypothetical protein